MSDQEIVDMFDYNPNLLLSDLSRITVKSITELKTILMGSTYSNYLTIKTLKIFLRLRQPSQLLNLLLGRTRN